jgi:hypothetical protein
MGKSFKFRSILKISPTTGFTLAELQAKSYVTNRMKVINHHPGILSDSAIIPLSVRDDVQLGMINNNLSERLEQANILGKICDLNNRSAAKVTHLEAAEAVQDGPSRELVAAVQGFDKLEEELQVDKGCSAKLEKRLDMCKTEPETLEQTDISQLRLEKDMLVHQVKNILPQKSSLESEFQEIEFVIQPIMSR